MSGCANKQRCLYTYMSRIRSVMSSKFIVGLRTALATIQGDVLMVTASQRKPLPREFSAACSSLTFQNSRGARHVVYISHRFPLRTRRLN